MLQINMLMDLGNGKSVVGAPGYLTPADKAKIDEMWSKKGTAVDITYDGDVQGYSTADSLGNVFAILTIPELENIRAELSEMRTRLDEIENTESADLSPVTERLTALEWQLEAAGNASSEELADRLNELEAKIDAQEDAQREYMRSVAFDSSTGVLSFKDGYNDAVFTVGGADYETVTPTLEG